MNKPQLADVVKLTKHIIEEYFKGKPEAWFDLLSNNSVFIATGEEMLFGAESIKTKLQKYGEKGRGKLYNSEYFSIPINTESAIVFAKTVSGKQKDDSYRITSLYTFVYKLIGTETKLIFEHTSYEYSTIEGSKLHGETLPMDMHTFKFVKHLLMDSPQQKRIPIPIGNQTTYLDLNTLMYIQADGRTTELHCLDRVISCPKSISEMKEVLTDEFYQIHRSYIINTRYLTGISCYRAELINGITIPIPKSSYGKAKKEIEIQLQHSFNKRKNKKA